jgi:anti-anti-sigma factor
MDVTRSLDAGVLYLKVDGRIDGYWADHLDSALNEAVGEGHHRIAVDCSGVGFLSSAGIGVLVKHHKQLARIKGGLHVVRPSPAVATVLRITRLADILIAENVTADVGTRTAPVMRPLEVDGLALDVYELDTRASLTLRALGTPEPLATGGFTEQQCVNLEGMTPAFAIGVGAFGDSFSDCRARFGELISVAGATAYQPADGTNVADYICARGALGADIRLLYGLSCDGGFSHLMRFEPLQQGESVSPSKLASACLQAAGADALGIVIVAETVGLVGAALRQSPATPLERGDFFTHPAVRTRLSFTAERAFTQSVSLSAGIVARRTSAIDGAQMRPLGAEGQGHLHAAAFRFHPIQKGFIELAHTIARLFEPDQLMGVMHLLSDDRGSAGAGESEFVRGACWIAGASPERANPSKRVEGA